jgi:hypothetical protein
MHKNDHFIAMFIQTPLHVSAYQNHHQGAHMILTSYLYVGVLYRKNLYDYSYNAYRHISSW